MTAKLCPDGDILELAPTEWKDWTGAEEALSKLARTVGAERYHGTVGPELPATPPPADRPSSERRGSRALARYLLAVGVGVAATLAWQSHGADAKRMVATWATEIDWPEPWQAYGAAKQTIARWVPEFDWSHAWQSYGEPAKQRIASWVPRLEWTNPGSGIAAGPPAQPAAPAWTAAQPQAAAPSAAMLAPATPAASPAERQQIEQMSADLAALRLDLEQVASLQQTIEQLADRQEQMARDIAKLQASDQRQKIAMPLPRPPGAPARRRVQIIPPPAFLPPR
jgi:hypothetical protein